MIRALSLVFAPNLFVDGADCHQTHIARAAYAAQSFNQNQCVVYSRWGCIVYAALVKLVSRAAGVSIHRRVGWSSDDDRVRENEKVVVVDG